MEVSEKAYCDAQWWSQYLSELGEPDAAALYATVGFRLRLGLLITDQFTLRADRSESDCRPDQSKSGSQGPWSTGQPLTWGPDHLI